MVYVAARRDSGKSGYEHLSIPQTTFLPSCLSQGKGIKLWGDMSPAFLRSVSKAQSLRFSHSVPNPCSQLKQPEKVF